MSKNSTCSHILGYLDSQGNEAYCYIQSYQTFEQWMTLPLLGKKQQQGRIGMLTLLLEQFLLPFSPEVLSPFSKNIRGPDRIGSNCTSKQPFFFFFSGWTTEWHNFNFYRNASSKETKLPCMSWGMSLPSPGYFPLLEAEVMEESWGDFSVSLLKTFCQLQEYFSRASLHPFLSLAEFRLMRSVSFLFKGENPCLLST